MGPTGCARPSHCAIGTACAPGRTTAQPRCSSSLEPGLLLTSGHYRNGVLLAPATAAWVLEQLEQESA